MIKMYFKNIFVLLFALTMLAIVSAMPNQEPPRLGASSPAKLSTAEKDLNFSLSKLAAGDGPNYKLGKIYSAEVQVVAGTLMKIVADLIDADGKTRKCNVAIWKRPWLPNGIEVTFECEGEEKVVRKHSA